MTTSDHPGAPDSESESDSNSTLRDTPQQVPIERDRDYLRTASIAAKRCQCSCWDHDCQSRCTARHSKETLSAAHVALNGRKRVLQVASPHVVALDVHTAIEDSLSDHGASLRGPSSDYVDPRCHSGSTSSWYGTQAHRPDTHSEPESKAGSGSDSEAGSHGAEPGGRLLRSVDQGLGRASAPGSGGHDGYDSHDGLNVPGLAAIRAAELVSCRCGLRSSLWYSLMAFTSTC
jgi:hypothetical protein